LLDLDKHNSFVFDFYIGSGDYPYSILDDFRKVSELKNKTHEAKSIMDKNNIVAHKLNGPPPNETWKNFNPNFNREPANSKGNINIIQSIIDLYSKNHD